MYLFCFIMQKSLTILFLYPLLLMQQSSKGMRSSKFCLHPAGDTPSSCRLFDAIVSHCVPVVVSDQIELPFEDEIDYSQFSIFFSTKEALQPGYMVDQLRKFPKEKWTEMWKQLKNVSHHYEFQYPPKREDAVSMLWRQVKHKLPGVSLSVHRSRRLKIPDWLLRKWFLELWCLILYILQLQWQSLKGGTSLILPLNWAFWNWDFCLSFIL